MKENKAITLIALIITIIVLLILAGVTLNMIMGDSGIFKKAQIAKEETNYANAAEKVAIAVSGSYDKTGLNKESLKENINKIQGLYEKITEVKYDLKIIVDGYKFTITEYGQITGEKAAVATLPENTSSTTAGTEVRLLEGWGNQNVTYVKTSNGTEVTTLETVATVYAISVGNGDTVPIPKEFYYVGGTKDSGVVISDNPNDKDRYKGQEDVGKDLQGNQFVWIPCSKSEYTKRDWGYSNNIWDDITPAAEETQIQKYEGFYVGRYEAGASEVTLTNGKKIGEEQLSASGMQNSSYVIGNTTLSSKPTSKANEIPYYHSDFTTAEQMSKRMYNTNYVNSGLITGTQWDVMLNFMSNETNKSVSNAGDSSKYTDLKANCDWGNYNNTTLNDCEGKYCIASASSTTAWKNNDTGSNRQSTYVILTTGATEGVKKKNLYDVAGNLWEWTQESVSSSSYYMLRGGSFASAYASNPACYRYCGTASLASTSCGFRVILYVK